MRKISLVAALMLLVVSVFCCGPSMKEVQQMADQKQQEIENKLQRQYEADLRRQEAEKRQVCEDAGGQWNRGVCASAEQVARTNCLQKKSYFWSEEAGRCVPPGGVVNVASRGDLQCESMTIEAQAFYRVRGRAFDARSYKTASTEADNDALNQFIMQAGVYGKTVIAEVLTPGEAESVLDLAKGIWAESFTSGHVRVVDYIEEKMTWSGSGTNSKYYVCVVYETDQRFVNKAYSLLEAAAQNKAAEGKKKQAEALRLLKQSMGEEVARLKQGASETSAPVSTEDAPNGSANFQNTW